MSLRLRSTRVGKEKQTCREMVTSSGNTRSELREPDRECESEPKSSSGDPLEEPASETFPSDMMVGG